MPNKPPIDLQKGNMPTNYGPVGGNDSYYHTTKSLLEGDEYDKLKAAYSEVDIKKKFNPFRFRNNVEPHIGGIPLIFVTTPQMNIFENETNQTSFASSVQSMVDMAGVYSATREATNKLFNNISTDQAEPTIIPDKICESLKEASDIFTMYNATDPELVKCLTYGESVGGSQSPWIKFLSNLFKGITLQDNAMRTIEEYESMYGWKQTLPGPNTDSFNTNTLSVNYEETKNLDVIKFHYMWMEYIEAVRYGLHSPSNQMRNRRTLDYTSSLYYFVLDFDLSKILYYTKYTGIYPTAVPLGLLSTGDITTKSVIDVGITYAYQYKTELRPSVLYDFNSVAKFAHKIIGYSRPSYLLDNDGKFAGDASNLKSQYGYGDIVERKNGLMPFKFNTEENRSYSNVEIKIISNKNYDEKNKTGFAHDTNLTRASFHLIFNNNDDEVYDEYGDSYGFTDGLKDLSEIGRNVGDGNIAWEAGEDIGEGINSLINDDEKEKDLFEQDVFNNSPYPSNVFNEENEKVPVNNETLYNANESPSKTTTTTISSPLGSGNLW